MPCSKGSRTQNGLALKLILSAAPPPRWTANFRVRGSVGREQQAREKLRWEMSS